MTLNNNDRATLIQYRMKQAWETIDDAKLLAENNKYQLQCFTFCKCETFSFRP